ncbi:zinc finger protein 85-like [Dreissena polymorpha]|uniref:C2H2-type domain-containing protein n=1 Tax=Dreissena polymorpha TaxID=45954 RepID=A0A9D4KHC7_DREPO|nr:zinc finger protein 85-like [Dreissena polymorpha]KAH3839560.1 hypothetical protein DPMN_112992 [Dreissena polymorpha]
MIEIFELTTTCLTKDYISTVPSSLLYGVFDNLKPFINIITSDGQISLQGQWKDIAKAYSELECCLKQSNAHQIQEISSFENNSNDVKTEVDIIALKVEPIDDSCQKPQFSENNDSDDTVDMEVPLAVVTKKWKEKYKCLECSYTTKNENWLEKHILRRHQKNIKCQDCGKKYGLKSDLKRHQIQVHKSIKRYFCSICKKYFKTKRYMDDHMQRHLEHYSYQCKLCQKPFSTKLMFSRHLKIQHPKSSIDLSKLGLGNLDEGDYTDENVNVSAFDRIMSTDTDNKVVYDSDIFKVTWKNGKNRRMKISNKMETTTGFPCHLCEYIGKRETNLETHIKRNHRQNLKCDICNKQFGYNWDLQRHIEQTHSETSFVCHICSKSYKTKKSFEEHLKSHEDGYVKSMYPCPHCEKTFSARQVLNSHLKYQHLGMKQKEKQRFLCQTCGREFVHKYSYDSHMNRHAGLLPFNCRICGKAFASEHCVREHQIVHKSVRKHTCSHCAKSFKTNSALKAHEAIHAGDKAYKCPVCGKGFVQKQSLLRHERIHSGYKPYKCLLCQRRFTEGATVRKHMILVHKKDPHDWQSDVFSYLKKENILYGDEEECPEIESNSHSSVENSLSLKGNQGYSTRTVTCIASASNEPLNSVVSSGIHMSNQFNSVTDQTGNYSYGHTPCIRPNQSLPVNNCYPGNIVSPQYSNPAATSVACASVQLSPASILNLSGHLAPIHNHLDHMAAVHSLQSAGNGPSVLNLSAMQNINYNQINDQ